MISLMTWHRMVLLIQIFQTHKHIDHIMGIIWMIRMICKHMRQGAYDGEAVIYGHTEVIALLRELSEKLIQKKDVAMIGQRLHLIPVEDGASKEILGKKVTFFDIQSTKAKQFGFCMDLGAGRKLTCCGDEPYNSCEEAYAKDTPGCYTKPFVCTDRRISSIRMRSIIPR